MRKLKKGFTIIELVIVIAVIAILTAVLVPTFISLSKKAGDSNDKTIVKNANIQLAAQESLEGKNKSMSEAVKDVDEIGYHMSSVPTSNGNKIVWDSLKDRFALLDKNNNVLLADGNSVSAHNKLYLAVSNYDDHEDFAIYARSDYAMTENKVSFNSDTKVSFDTGDRENVEEVKYLLNDDDSANIEIATNSADTAVIAYGLAATFKHTGIAASEDIKCAPSSFHEYGKVGFVKVQAGHYVAENGADVKVAYSCDNAVVVDKSGSGAVGKLYGDEDTNINTGNVPLDAGSGAKSENDAKTEGQTELDKDLNPEPAKTGIAIDSSNYSTVFADNPTETNFYLTEDLSISSDWVLVSSANEVLRTIVLDLNGHVVDRVGNGNTLSLGRLADITIKNGTVRNSWRWSEDGDNYYAIVAYNSVTFSLDNVVVSGLGNCSVGCLNGQLHLKTRATNINGYIFAEPIPIGGSSSSVLIDGEGTFMISCETWAFLGYHPDVTVASGYTETHTAHEDGEPPYMEYVVTKN